MDINGAPNANCIFYPDVGGSYEVMMTGEEGQETSKDGKASMMYMPSLDSVSSCTNIPFS